MVRTAYHRRSEGWLALSSLLFHTDSPSRPENPTAIIALDSPSSTVITAMGSVQGLMPSPIKERFLFLRFAFVL